MHTNSFQSFVLTSDIWEMTVLTFNEQTCLDLKHYKFDRKGVLEELIIY
jgi:hypothetical protein